MLQRLLMGIVWISEIDCLDKVHPQNGWSDRAAGAHRRPGVVGASFRSGRGQSSWPRALTTASGIGRAELWEQTADSVDQLVPGASSCRPHLARYGCCMQPCTLGVWRRRNDLLWQAVSQRSRAVSALLAGPASAEPLHHGIQRMDGRHPINRFYICRGGPVEKAEPEARASASSCASVTGLVGSAE